MPASCQSRNLRQQLIPEPQFISCGSIRQGIPLRRTNKTPWRQARSDKRGLPPWSEGVRASGLDLALTLAVDRANTPLARSEVFDAVIRSRALVFDELAARHRSAYGSGDPEVKQLADQLSSARARLATLVFRGARRLLYALLFPRDGRPMPLMPRK